MPEPPSELKAKLKGYAQAFLTEFNAIRSELLSSGLPASLYAHELVQANIIPAADGCAIYYLNSEAVNRGQRLITGSPNGASVLTNFLDKPLAEVVQVFSANHIKLYSRAVGDNVFEAPRLPADFPLDVASFGVNTKVLEPFMGKQEPGPAFIGVAIGPTLRTEDGKVAGRYPSRKTVFSPALGIQADSPPVLQFLYPFVELLWDVEQLQLDAETAKQHSRADVDILKLSVAANIPPQALAESPYTSVAARCELACNELASLIDLADTEEKHVQEFLELPRNQFLLYPQARNITPQQPLSGLRFRIDFAVQREDADYHLIEIESPKTRIYQEKGEEPAAGFTHAIQQVEDWLQYVEDHKATVREVDGMPEINKPTGEVVIGRNSHMSVTARKRFDYKRGENPRITLKTYDMMIAAGRAFAANLRRMGA